MSKMNKTKNKEKFEKFIVKLFVQHFLMFSEIHFGDKDLYLSNYESIVYKLMKQIFLNFPSN
jgi:hypothetical protein